MPVSISSARTNSPNNAAAETSVPLFRSCILLIKSMTAVSRSFSFEAYGNFYKKSRFIIRRSTCWRNDRWKTILTIVLNYIVRFFGIMIFPVYILHKHTKDICFFINLSKFSEYIKIPLLLLGLISTAVIFKLPLPYDVMSSFVIWLYLYFCNIFKE